MELLTLSTVVTPAASYDLTDLATVHDELRIPIYTITDDPFLSRAITQISSAISRFCNRVFAVEMLCDTIYPERDAYSYQMPGGIAPLQLSRWPLVSVTSVTITDQSGIATLLVANVDYKIDMLRGWLIRLDPSSAYPVPWSPVQITVTYTAGFSDIPADLVDVVLRLITARYYSRGRDPTLKSQTQPNLGDQTYWVGSTPGVTGPYSDDILSVLESYRQPVVA